MQILRQSTAQAIQLGPFVDDIDAVTPETGLTIANTDIRVSKDGGSSANKNSGGATVDGSNGFYTATLDITDTNTVGLLDINIAMSGALPVFIRFQIIETATYDSIYADGATALALDSKLDIIDTNVDAVLVDTAEIVNLNDFDPANDAVANVTLVGTTTTNTDMRGTDGANTTVPDNAGIAAIEADTQDIQSRLPASLVTGKMDSDATSISGDSAAADNLESMYDGTGYDDPTAPSSAGQVSMLSTGSAAISTGATSRTLTIGTEVNSVDDTHELDGVEHEVTSVGGAFDLIYDFETGESGVGVEITMVGRLNTGDDALAVQAYNWVTTSWDQIGTLQGSGATENSAAIFNLVLAHTGTDANAGEIRIRGYAASGLTSAVLYLDQVFVSFAIVKAIQDSNLVQISGSAPAADNLEASALGIISDEVATIGSTTTCTLTNAPAVADVLIGRVIVVTSGSLAGEAKTITANTVGRLITFEEMSGTLSSSDKVVLV